VTPQEIQITYDYDRANHHTMKYIAPVITQLQVRGQMLSNAMNKFTSFLDTKETPSLAWAIINAAYSILISAVPLLRFTKLLTASEAAVAAAATSGDTRALAIQFGEMATAFEKQIKGPRDIALKLSSIIDLMPEGADSLKKLNKLDASKGPIREMQEFAIRVLVNWSIVLDILDMEKYARLSNPTKQPKESQLALAQRLLPIPQWFTDDELDQIEKRYLWEMMKDYCRKYVKIQVDRRDGKKVGYIGLNGAQADIIVDLFRPGLRGPYFVSQLFPATIYVALEKWGVGTVSVSTTYMSVTQ